MVTVDYDAKVIAQQGNTVNMRSNPSTNARVIEAVRIGTIVHVLGEEGDGWAYIE